MTERDWSWEDDYGYEEGTWPLVCLRGVWVYPKVIVHFDAGRAKSLKAIEEALVKDSRVVLLAQKDRMVEDPGKEDLYSFGILAEIKQIFKMPNGNARILVEGIDRAQVLEIDDTEEMMSARVGVFKPLEGEKDGGDLADALKRVVVTDMKKLVQMNSDMPNDIIYSLMDIEDPGRLADLCVSYLDLKPEQNQTALEELDPINRLNIVYDYLEHEIELKELEDDINQKVRKSMSDSQKEYYLREQLQAIKSELGEDYEDDEDSIEDYMERIEALPIEEDSKESLRKEAKKLKYAQMGSPDAGVTRTYLDYVLDLPWDKSSRERLDIKRAREVLDQDHYGLEDVKERILEFLSVRKLKKGQKGMILCLVGPPGVGKTSIVRSIARALNRKFVSMRLGGVTDEAEIRGHRKTYVGAMPGRIISLIDKAGTKNPVFLLDEIDKVGNDYRGDPSSALLEVLDPEQNKEFIDNYLEIPFDLSDCMFITTANTSQTIPDALLDRMEIIEVPGYTEEEKFQIAKRYLVPKEEARHGLKKGKLTISDNVIRNIIRSYTRESGVRDLERQIAKICRRSAKKIVEEESENIRVTVSNQEKFLDKPRVFDDDIPKEDMKGVTIGMAWTQVGGEVLVIEANIMPGKGSIILTGSLGDVMKESAQAAITYIRSHSKDYGLEDDFYQKIDIHVHVPEGATPKDGPSAGVTIATSLLSALTEKKVRSDLAMTGEITLRGRVLPIGGLKEKALAAYRYGLKEIIIPRENMRDVEDFPKELKEGLKISPVDEIGQVFEKALVKNED